MERFVNLRLIVVLAISLCLGIFCAYLLIFSSLIFAIAVLVLYISGIGLYFLPYKNGDKLKTKAVFSILFVLVFIFGGLNFNLSVKDYQKADLNGHYYTATAKVKEVVKTDNGVRLLVSNIKIDGNVSGKLKYNAYLYVNGDSEFNIGNRIEFNTAFNDNQTVYEGKFSATNIMRKVKYTANLDSIDIKIIANNPNLFERVNLFVKDALSSGLNGDEYGVAYALLTGQSEFMDYDTLTSYRNAGVAHIFAVSGLHIGFLATAIGFLLFKLRLNRLIRVFIIFPILLFYSGVCGFSASSIRATVMVTVSLLVAVRGIRYDGLTSVAISALIVLSYSPMQLFYVGFQLSFVVVLGMMVLSKPISKLFFFLPQKLSNSLGAVLSAQISAIPISLYSFGWFSFISIIANLVFIPVVSVIFVTLLLLTIVGGIFGVSSIVLFPIKYVLMAVNFCINIFDYDIFIVGGFTLSVFAVLYYFALIVASGLVNFKKRLKIVSFILCAVICTVGTICVNVNEQNTVKAYVIGSESLCATLIYTKEENTLIVSDVKYVYNVNRLKRLNNYGITKIDNVVLMNGYNVDAQVFLTKLRTSFTLDKVFYYGEKNDVQENVVKKSFPEIEIYSVSGGKLPVKGFECVYFYDGRILDCRIEDKSVLIFSVPDADRAFVNTEKQYDMVISGKLCERVFAVYSSKEKVAYRRSSIYTDAESNGNLTYKFR